MQSLIDESSDSGSFMKFHWSFLFFLIRRDKRGGIPTIPENMTIFQKKHKHGVIDVWWLYDDGGNFVLKTFFIYFFVLVSDLICFYLYFVVTFAFWLARWLLIFITGLTILLPYIISTRSNWEHCEMRIFALANHKTDIGAQEKEWVSEIFCVKTKTERLGRFFRLFRTGLMSRVAYRMAEIMNKFRIKYTCLRMVDDISVQPREETKKFFDDLISDFRTDNDSDNVNGDWSMSHFYLKFIWRELFDRNPITSWQMNFSFLSFWN